MHEIALCQSLLEQAMKARETSPFNRVVRVSLSVGRTSRVQPDALRHAFDLLSRDTFLEGAELRIDQPPGDGFRLLEMEVS
jgi:hydrogenase nickel incorporation protein HypA/HybF